jgi:hypothetical protein
MAGIFAVRGMWQRCVCREGMLGVWWKIQFLLFVFSVGVLSGQAV